MCEQIYLIITGIQEKLGCQKQLKLLKFTSINVAQLKD